MRLFTYLFALALVVLAGCSGSAATPTSVLVGVTPSNSAPPTGTAAATSAPPTATGAATLPATAAPSATPGKPKSTPVAAGQDCGTITMLGPNPPQDANALQSEQCFWQAYQQCTVATLTVTMRGVDAGMTHQFTLDKTGGSCTIVDTLQSYVVPIRTPSANKLTCASLVQQNGGLLFKSCGDQGDIAVPAPTP